jgi:hypothetical protein
LLLHGVYGDDLNRISPGRYSKEDQKNLTTGRVLHHLYSRKLNTCSYLYNWLNQCSRYLNLVHSLLLSILCELSKLCWYNCNGKVRSL